LVQTSADVSFEVRGAPVSLLLTVKPTPAPSPVAFTISGLRLGWTYYLSRDGSDQL
jgi:hypothetical protein